MNYISETSSSNERMFNSLLLVSGHSPADFSFELCDDDRVRVHGPNGTATYPASGWISRFGKHLYEGLFDEATV